MSNFVNTVGAEGQLRTKSAGGLLAQPRYVGIHTIGNRQRGFRLNAATRAPLGSEYHGKAHSHEDRLPLGSLFRWDPKKSEVQSILVDVQPLIALKTAT